MGRTIKFQLVDSTVFFVDDCAFGCLSAIEDGCNTTGVLLSVGIRTLDMNMDVKRV